MLRDLNVQSTVLSVVVPMYNEEENVAPFLVRLIGVLDAMALRYEVLMVDDGSSDSTWAAIQQAAQEYPGVRGLRLVRNFGHQAALLAGLKHAQGLAIVSMDGDLQHPPELIPRLLELWRKGADVVTTLRTYNHDTGWLKKLTSAMYYRCFSYLSGTRMQSGQSDFRLLDRSALDQLLAMQQSDIFLRGAVSWLNYPTETIHFVATSRQHGESKYTLAKMMCFARSGILAFSTKPLQVGIMFGLTTSALSFIFLAWIFVQYVLGNTVQGWASTLGLLSLLFGVLFVLLGIIGTYLGRIYLMLQRRPHYVLDERSMTIQTSTLAEVTKGDSA
jgi:glycosyltransferase involved in cell wall biosynthesis